MSEPGSLLRSLSGRSTARNYHSHVINEIGAGVISGRYAIGTTLPNDAELMEEFEVSRTVLREALKTLEAGNHIAYGIVANVSHVEST